MNKIAVVVGVVLLVVSMGFIYVMTTLPAEPAPTVYVDESFEFVDAQGSEITVEYDESADFARVTFADNQYELSRVASGSGTRYESANGLVVFSEHQGEVRLEVGDQPVVVGFARGADLAALGTTEQLTDLDVVEVDQIEVVEMPVLGQRCVDGPTIDCAALEAAAMAEYR